MTWDFLEGREIYADDATAISVAIDDGDDEMLQDYLDRGAFVDARQQIDLAIQVLEELREQIRSKELELTEGKFYKPLPTEK